MESLPLIEWCLQHLNYWTIFILMAIESSFIPFPSEVVIPPAAYLAATGNDLNIYMVILSGTAGSLVGALFNYYLAFFLGRPIVSAFSRSRIGAMCLLNEKKVERAEAYFARHGALSTFIGRLIPGVRQLISIPAGLSRMALPTFIIYTILGAGIWNTILAMLGYYLSDFIPREELMGTVSRYSHEIGIGILIIAIVVVGFLYYKGHQRGRENKKLRQKQNKK